MGGAERWSHHFRQPKAWQEHLCLLGPEELHIVRQGMDVIWQQVPPGWRTAGCLTGQGPPKSSNLINAAHLRGYTGRGSLESSERL